MNHLEIFKHSPDTKEKQLDMANQILEFALSGNVNPLSTEILLKSLENTINMVRKNLDFKSAVDDEIYKYPEKTFSFDGCSITKNTRRSPDYSKDEIWKILKKQVRDREDFLKSLPTDKDVFDEEGVKIEPPVFKHSEYWNIKFE